MGLPVVPSGDQPPVISELCTFDDQLLGHEVVRLRGPVVGWSVFRVTRDEDVREHICRVVAIDDGDVTHVRRQRCIQILVVRVTTEERLPKAVVPSSDFEGAGVRYTSNRNILRVRVVELDLRRVDLLGVRHVRNRNAVAAGEF